MQAKLMQLGGAYSFTMSHYISIERSTNQGCRERRNQKRERLGSSASHSSLPFAGEKEMELKEVERGDPVASDKPATYTVAMAAGSQSSNSVDKALPVPPAAYQPPKQIKRKAVPVRAPQKPRFSWLD